MKKLVIAVVEDDADDRDFICSALMDPCSNVEILAFSGGKDFFSFLETSVKLPDLVVTDLRMPLISGFDVIRQIKADDTTKETTVVVLSTSSNQDDIEKAKDLGAAGYYVKPYNLKGYEDIKLKIMERLNFNSFLPGKIVDQFLKTFQVLIPHPAL